MKILFFSCLALLALLARAQASEAYPEILHKEIALIKLAEKPLFEKLLLKISEEAHVCPVRLFSIGMDQWEKIPAKNYEKELRLMANMIKHLN